MPRFRPQARRFMLALVTLGAGLVAFALAVGDAAANGFVCQRYRSELASLGDGNNVQRAIQGEIARLQAYFQTLNCDGSRFALFEARPPQCDAAQQRIRALQAGYGAENGALVAARRRQLQAAITTQCGSAVATAPNGMPAAAPGEQTLRNGGLGGNQVVCVKTCDGSYFPLNNLPDGRVGADTMCQALCPGTQAVAYAMPQGDDSLKRAATIRGGRAYTALPNAFKFRTAFLPACTCKREGQGWAQSLAKAESLLVRHKGDIFVTPMQAERLSKPRVRLVLVGRAERTAAELAADAASRSASAETRAWADPPKPGEPEGAGTTASIETPRSAVRVIAPDIVASPVPLGAQ